MSNKILLTVLVAIFIADTFLFDFAYAQNYDAVPSDYEKRIMDVDSLLNLTLTGSLTGLSLTAATFLVNASRNTEQQDDKYIQTAKRRFIMAFVMFLSCTVTIFFFDFIEILQQTHIPFLIADTIVTYGIFSAGLFLLLTGAKNLYRSWNK